MSETELGNYRILEKLGAGGMGVVYKAIDTTLDRVVAIKILNRDLSRIPELMARFRGEAKAQANLNHTNLATLYAFLTIGENAMMVMEFIDGETFQQIIRRRGPLPVPGAVQMFRQGLLGFAYAHRAGIVHRDIKPSNLMLNRQGIVKVMDFGIAKTMGERGLTQTGMRVGTSRYMSPEQVLNKEADLRSDIYALGITLYEMLTASAPFESDSEFQLMSDHVNTPPPPPSLIVPGIPKGVENAILKALAKNPDERFQTVEEFGAALEHLYDFGVIAPVVTVPPVPPPQTRAAPAKAVPPRPSPKTAPTQTIPLPAFTPAVAPPAAVPPAQRPAPPPQPIAAPPRQGTPRPPVPAPAPAVARRPATGLGALLGTWPGRIVLGGIAVLVLLLVGLLVLGRGSPEPLPEPIAPQVTPSQVVNPAPNPERVDIEMGSNVAAPLQVKTFEAAPNPVRAGQRTTLNWSVPGAIEVTIGPSIGTVPAEGSRAISTRTDAQFTLTAKAIDGQTVSRTLNVAVLAAGKPSPAQPSPAPTPAPPPATPPPTQQKQAPVQSAPQPAPQQGSPQPAPSQPAAPQQARVSPVMNLYHDHGVRTGNQPGWPSCWGRMQIGGGRVVYHVLGTSDGRRDDFVAPVSAVEEVKVNRVPIRGHPAFHMRINGQNFNFIPASGSPVLFVNTIEQWLQAK
jgi:serine/threonine-protein kinase